MKTKLTLLPDNGGPFNCQPAHEVELSDEDILCNDVTLPWDFNPHNTRLYVIGNEFGALCAVWANHEQDALDTAVNENKLDSMMVSEEDYDAMDEDEREGCASLGNAGEPFNLDHAWIQQVRLDPTHDCRLLCAFAEARGACANNLYK